ncbi:MAG: Panacea domain-containing protein [Hyphomicrobiaceae bacterium]
MEFNIVEPKCDRLKLLDAVHYICSRCDKSELGNVKLHKILYFADMLHFATSGKPLTGVQYLKQRFGPCARQLSSVVEELGRKGDLVIQRRDYFGFEKVDYEAVTKPKSERLGNLGLSILDDVIEFVCRRSAREISELSHNAAWEAVNFGEVIHYDTAFWLQPVEVTDADVAFAESELNRNPAFAA